MPIRNRANLVTASGGRMGSIDFGVVGEVEPQLRETQNRSPRSPTIIPPGRSPKADVAAVRGAVDLSALTAD